MKDMTTGIDQPKGSRIVPVEQCLFNDAHPRCCPSYGWGEGWRGWGRREQRKQWQDCETTSIFVYKTKSALWFLPEHQVELNGIICNTDMSLWVPKSPFRRTQFTGRLGACLSRHDPAAATSRRYGPLLAPW